MKTTGSGNTAAGIRRLATVVCLASLGMSCMHAENTPETQNEEPSLNNWIKPSFGGLIINGNQAQFQQANPTTGPVNGGIKDMHYQQSLGDKTTFTIDGHALFYNGDYKLNLEFNQQDLGYFKAGYTGFTSYFNGNGGYVPPTASLRGTLPEGLFGSGPEYQLYRGSLWAELGLRKEGLPELTLRYEHNIRKGREDSTMWGPAYAGPAYTAAGAPAAGAAGSATFAGGSLNRMIMPAFRNLNESREIVTLDGKQLFGKPDSFGNTEVNLGLRFEYNNNDDYYNWQSAVPATPYTKNGAPVQNPKNIPLTAATYNLTQGDNQNLGLYSGHVSSVTRFGEKLMMTMGYSYAVGNSSISGDRITGPYADSPYAPYWNNGSPLSAVANTGGKAVNTVAGLNANQGVVPPGTYQYGGIASSYLNMGGSSQYNQNVALLNFLWTPIEGVSITPALRYENNNTQSTSAFLTQVSQAATNFTAAGTTYEYLRSQAGLAKVYTFDQSGVFLNGFAQSLEIDFKKIQNCVLFAKAELGQQFEARNDSTPQGSLNYGTPTALGMNANNTWINQKYTMGANWYPLANLNGSIQYYRQLQNYTQSFLYDDPLRPNQRTLAQGWITDDGNVRATWTPFSTVAFVSRWDVQQTEVNSSYMADGMAGGSTFNTPMGQTSKMQNSIFTESATWTPADRLFLQAGLSYVLNQTTSPAVNYNAGLQASKNNYWIGNLGAGYQIDRKTELRGDLNYYRANDYQNNSSVGMPYNAGAEQYTVSVSLNRLLTRNASMSLKYFFDTYRDQLSGGYNNYTAQMIATTLNLQF